MFGKHEYTVVHNGKTAKVTLSNERATIKITPHDESEIEIVIRHDFCDDVTYANSVIYKVMCSIGENDLAFKVCDLIA